MNRIELVRLNTIVCWYDKNSGKIVRIPRRLEVNPTELEEIRLSHEEFTKIVGDYFLEIFKMP